MSERELDPTDPPENTGGGTTSELSPDSTERSETDPPDNTGGGGGGS
jgi:hypothetical protein